MASRNHEVDIARFFHEMTKHSSASSRSSGHMLDWENMPCSKCGFDNPGGMSAVSGLQRSRSSALDATRRTRPGSSSVANARRCLPSVACASDPRLVISSVFRCGTKSTVSSSGVTKAAVARDSESFVSLDRVLRSEGEMRIGDSNADVGQGSTSQRQASVY